MIKKLKFEVKYESDFQVLGIFSSLSNYRLCWFINKHLSLKLSRTNDISLTPFKVEKPQSFSLFTYMDRGLMIEYYLLNNRKNGHILLPEPKNLDYLLLLKSKDFRIDIENIVAKLRSIKQIAAVIWLKETEKVKNLNNLLYDFELAIIEK